LAVESHFICHVSARTSPASLARQSKRVAGDRGMKHELRVMLAQGSGSIVNLSSTMGHRGAAAPR